MPTAYERFRFSHRGQVFQAAVCRSSPVFATRVAKPPHSTSCSSLLHCQGTTSISWFGHADRAEVTRQAAKTDTGHGTKTFILSVLRVLVVSFEKCAHPARVQIVCSDSVRQRCAAGFCPLPVFAAGCAGARRGIAPTADTLVPSLLDARSCPFVPQEGLTAPVSYLILSLIRRKPALLPATAHTPLPRI